MLTLCLCVLLAQPAPSPPPAPDSLRAYHELLASEPHVAGTPGDARTIQRLADAFRGMGIADVQVDEVWPLLATPVEAALEVVTPTPLTLDLRERPILGDPTVAALNFDDPFLVPFCAFSGSGDVTGRVVYANRCTLEDFQKLRELGVDCTGAIVIGRYGGNYRGYKAKFAEAAGAAGLIMFSDPADVGYAKGLPYPEGTWANECCTQRGSILVMPYQGDPLTPGIAAAKDAPRIPESQATLSRIPVQPIGYGPAKEILSRMTGAEVPSDAWQGGLPFRYRVEGGDLRVRLKVVQQREIKRTANVIATIRGSERPDEVVVVGCHHDAWVMGASDPLAGTIVLLEAARTLAAEAAAGRPPKRTVVFAAWAAEEWGIIGSSEWVEAQRDRLLRQGVMYINLDAASMGLTLNAGASPVVRGLVRDAAGRVPGVRERSTTVFDWEKTVGGDPLAVRTDGFGDLGGGSDHVGFLCHVGVPSVHLGGTGSTGTAYHSAYDSVAWYRRAVGDDYASAMMITRVCNEIVREAADRPLLPRDFGALLNDFRRHLREHASAATTAKLVEPASGDALPEPFAALDRRAVELQPLASAVMSELSAARLDPERLHTANRLLRETDLAWLRDGGLPGREWFKNTYASPDENAGYSPWVLPLLAKAVQDKDAPALRDGAAQYATVLETLGQRLTELEAVLRPAPKQDAAP